MEREWNPGDLSFGFQIFSPEDELAPEAPCPSCGAENWSRSEVTDNHYCASCGTEVETREEIK